MSRAYLLIFLLVVIVGKGLGQLDRAQKQYILDLHNEERRINPAPNMKKMVSNYYIIIKISIQFSAV